MKTNRPALLDVNVLIALIDPAHQFHGNAHDWFARNRRRGWATCPLTENGCVRIMSKPGYPFPGLTAAKVREILAAMVCADGHLFWPDNISILDEDRFDLGGARSQELTDIYLLGIASAAGGRLATFDRNIDWTKVVGCGAESVEVLGG